MENKTSDKPERGTARCRIAGEVRVLRLTLGGVEEWEDRNPRGIYGVSRSVNSTDRPPTATEMVGLARAALIGGGMSPQEVAAVLEQPGAVLECLPAGLRAMEAFLTPDGDVDLGGDDDDGGTEGKGKAETGSA